MKTIQYTMKPRDLLILLKIIAAGTQALGQVALAEALNMSQSEISQSLVRSKFSGLLDGSGKKVMGMGLLDFLQHGLAYVFPQKPGAIVRGIPTAHSAPPLDKEFQSDEVYVWPSASGQVRGQSIQPLYPSVVEAAKKDEKLYQLLALADVLRVGKVREKNLALKELKQRIMNDPKSK